MAQDTVRTGFATESHVQPKFLSDHLSNERTFLSYLRTAVSLMSFGIAINRFSHFLAQSNSASSTPRMVSSERVGIGMVALGIAVLVWAGVHYVRIFGQIERQDFRARRASILILTALVLIFALGGVVWLFIN
jgi:putative membrane protein